MATSDYKNTSSVRLSDDDYQKLRKTGPGWNAENIRKLAQNHTPTFKAYLKDYCDRAAERTLQDIAKREAARPPIDLGIYHHRLQCTNWTQPESYKRTMWFLFDADVRNHVKPVGFTDNKSPLKYYFRAGDGCNPAENDLEPGAQIHEAVHLRPPPGRRTNIKLKYGYLVGALEYEYDGQVTESGDTHQELPFNVYLDVADPEEALWAVAYDTDLDCSADYMQFSDPNTRIWHHLPNDDRVNQVDFRVVKLGLLKNLENLSGLFGPLRVEESKSSDWSSAYLQPYVARQTDVINEIEKRKKTYEASEKQ